MIDTVVYYHSNCPDGFGSAWAFYKKYGDKAKYIPYRYGDAISNYNNKDIFFLDCSCERDVLLKIKKEAKSVNVIDHHITALKKLHDLDFCHIDMNNSGCVLSWKYLFPEQEVPLILQYVEDRDLWKWNLKHSKEVLSYIDTFDRTIEIWSNLDLELNCKDEKSSDYGFQKIVRSGRDIMRYKNSVSKKISKNIEKIKLCGYNGVMVNSPFLQGEIADELTKYDLILIYYKVGGIYKCSLRTSKDYVDVSKVAEKFNGGGHKKASGFITSNLNGIIE